MGLIDTFKIDGNVASKYKENRSDKYPSRRVERGHEDKFKLRDVVSVRLISDPGKMNKKVLGDILKHAHV